MCITQPFTQTYVLLCTGDGSGLFHLVNTDFCIQLAEQLKSSSLVHVLWLFVYVLKKVNTLNE